MAHKEILDRISCDPKAVLGLPKDLLREESFTRSAIAANAMCVLHVPEWREDAKLLLLAIELAPSLYIHLRPPLSNNKALIHQALRLQGLNLGSVPSRFRDDFDMVHLAVANNGKSLRYASDRLRADERVIQQAIASVPESIEYAMGPCDEHVMQAIRGGYVSAFRHGSTQLREDRDVAMQVVDADESMCQYVHHRSWPRDLDDYDTIERLRRKFKNKRERET